VSDEAYSSVAVAGNLAKSQAPPFGRRRLGPTLRRRRTVDSLTPNQSLL
jgi:hypothetical protein